MWMQPVGYIMRRSAVIGIALQLPSDGLCSSIAGGPSSGRGDSIRFERERQITAHPPSLAMLPVSYAFPPRGAVSTRPPGTTSKEEHETHRSARRSPYTAKTSLLRISAS